MINANRNLAAYESFGAPVWPDEPGRLSPGRWPVFLPGWSAAKRPTCSPCPATRRCFPPTWSARLADALARETPTSPWPPRAKKTASCAPQPVFCLMRPSLLESLAALHAGGGRKIDAWTAQHKTVIVPFDQPGDEAHAFFNANTLAELHQLEAKP